MREVGCRVGAILDVEGNKVRLLGYGVYEGDKVPDKNAVGLMAEGLRQNRKLNPKIKLDNGKVVWGCECWWGTEEEIKGYCERRNREIVEVDIDKVRAEQE